MMGNPHIQSYPDSIGSYPITRFAYQKVCQRSTEHRIFHVHFVVPAGAQNDNIPLLSRTITRNGRQVDECPRHHTESVFGTSNSLCSVSSGKNNISSGNLFCRIIERRIAKVRKSAPFHAPRQPTNLAVCKLPLPQQKLPDVLKRRHWKKP